MTQAISKKVRNPKTRFLLAPTVRDEHTPLIDPRKRYLCRLDERWEVGKFTKMWYGWNFDGFYMAGAQIEFIDEIYEFIVPGMTPK